MWPLYARAAAAAVAVAGISIQKWHDEYTKSTIYFFFVIFSIFINDYDESSIPLKLFYFCSIEMRHASFRLKFIVFWPITLIRSSCHISDELTIQNAVKSYMRGDRQRRRRERNLQSCKKYRMHSKNIQMYSMPYWYTCNAKKKTEKYSKFGTCVLTYRIRFKQNSSRRTKMRTDFSIQIIWIKCCSRNGMTFDFFLHSVCMSSRCSVTRRI